MTTRKIIFIEWQETEQEFQEWRYVGNGVTEPVFEPKTVTRRLRFSNDYSEAMLERARTYIAKDRPEGELIIEDEEWSN